MNSNTTITLGKKKFVINTNELIKIVSKEVDRVQQKQEKEEMSK